ncbi:hypothetical protein, partial [Alistipes putredinis]|uniref:hypothetical protein n=1 Tax=Alistipes putredinis TaxID=28117 RepID=UPI00242BBC68
MKSLSKATFHLLCCILLLGTFQSCKDDETTPPPPGESATLTISDVKAEARSKARGKVAWLDSFFEYLADSFRPILGVLLGASIIVVLGVVDDMSPLRAYFKFCVQIFAAL